MIKKLLIFACAFALFACSSDDELDRAGSQQAPQVTTTFSDFTKYVTSYDYWSGPLDFVMRYGGGSTAGFATLKFKVNPLNASSLVVTDVKNDKSTIWEYTGTTTFNGKTCISLTCEGLTMCVSSITKGTIDEEGDYINQFELSGYITKDGKVSHYIVHPIIK